MSKNYDPSPLCVQKSNKRKYDTQTKMVSYDSAHIGQNLHMTQDCDLCDLCPQIDLRLPFSPVTQYHKTTHTASPNELDQISLPQASMAPGTTFHDPHYHSQI